MLLGVALTAAFYWWQTRLPDRVVIAGGPADGRYDQLAQEIAAELRSRLGIQVSVLKTHGSLDNLHRLERGEVSIALYQSETRSILESTFAGTNATPPKPEGDNPLQPKGEQRKQLQALLDDTATTDSTRFIANLYPEYLIPVTGAATPHDLLQLDDHTVCSNDPMSGDHAMLALLLEHLRKNPAQCETVPYLGLPAAFENKTIDLAVINCGLGAPVLDHVLRDTHAQLAEIPFIDSFVSKNAALTKRVIPAGYFAMEPEPIPLQDFETVTTQAQLLAAKRTSVRLVETVTEIVMDPRFQRCLRLTDLNAGGENYATSRPEFPMHVGASHIFNPELKPLLNPDFVEGTEGIRSFLVSIIAAVWLARRWWKRRELLSQEHRLDRYIKDVLEIERDQIGLDGEHPDDAEGLQKLLDRVTHLRQAALSEFTAHELNEDQAVDCFVEMCHALSDKISGKLTRHALRHVVAATQHDSNGSQSI